MFSSQALRGLVPLVLLAGLLLLAVWHRPPRAEAEVRRSEPVEPFKSGGERSEALLAEILATLQRMDQRLERLERVAEVAAPDGTPQIPPRVVPPAGTLRTPLPSRRAR